MRVMTMGKQLTLTGLLFVISSVAFGQIQTSTTSTSSSTMFNDIVQPVIPVYTYRSQLLGVLQGSPTLFYNQTFTGLFDDTAVAAAMAALTSANSGNPLSFIGPTFETSIQSLIDSNTVTTPVGSPLLFDQFVTLEDTVGPFTIIIGDRDNGGTAFEVLHGTNNLNRNTHSLFQLTRNIQTTESYEVLDTWRLVGVPESGPVSVPEPGTMPLLGLGLLAMWMGNARRRARSASVS